MTWEVEFHPEFAKEYAQLAEAVQDELAALIKLLKAAGPQLKRPRADKLNGSKHANMKELRFDADNGLCRVAFAFDQDRSAILLPTENKSGGAEKRFYRRLIAKPNARFHEHLAAMQAARRKK